MGVGRVIKFRTYRLLQAGLDVFWLGFDYLVSEFIMRRIRQDFAGRLIKDYFTVWKKVLVDRNFFLLAGWLRTFSCSNVTLLASLLLFFLFLLWFMSKVIKPIAERLEFPEIHWHALRHWNNSAMLNSGIDPSVRMKRVGHSSVKTNLIYSHADLALQKAASDAIWQRLELAKQELERKKKEEEEKASLSPLSVTLSVTPNRGVPQVL